MTLDEGATHEIISRWPAYKQRNCALDFNSYEGSYCSDMMVGIKLIRDHHESLTLAGETTWSISASLSDDLDALAGI